MSAAADNQEVLAVLQKRLGGQVMLVVGSGLSAAESLPTMGELADHFLTKCNNVEPGYGELYKAFVENLKAGMDMESALDGVRSVNDEFIEFVVREVSGVIQERERDVFISVLNGDRVLPLSKLLDHLSKTNDVVNVVTPNYDRLIELAAEGVGLGVDTSFVGQTLGKFNADVSGKSFCCGVASLKGRAVLQYRKRIALMKPHGSLDWYIVSGNPVRIMHEVSLTRLMIAPGYMKYMHGYRQPFDEHRERANREMRAASGFIIIGYGFNDFQLEQHLRQRIKVDGLPALLITKELTNNAEGFLSECDSMIAVTSVRGEPAKAAVIMGGGRERVVLEKPIWDLSVFIEEVL